MSCKLEDNDGAQGPVPSTPVTTEAAVGGAVVDVRSSAVAPNPPLIEWEVAGFRFRSMTPSYDLGVEPNDMHGWRWWVKDADFGDVVATGHASDVATAQSAARQVALLMEQDA